MIALEFDKPPRHAARRRYAQLKAIQDASEQWLDPVGYVEALIPKVRVALSEEPTK